MVNRSTKNEVNQLKATIFEYGRGEMSVSIGMLCANLSLLNQKNINIVLCFYTQVENVRAPRSALFVKGVKQASNDRKSRVKGHYLNNQSTQEA